MTTRREGEGKAGVKSWVVDAGVSGKLGREATQKVTIQLIPRGPGGQGPALVRDLEERIRDLEKTPSGPRGSAMRDVERE